MIIMCEHLGSLLWCQVRKKVRMSESPQHPQAVAVQEAACRVYTRSVQGSHASMLGMLQGMVEAWLFWRKQLGAESHEVRGCAHELMPQHAWHACSSCTCPATRLLRKPRPSFPA